MKAAKIYYVRATVAADANHNTATSADVKFTVAKAANPMAEKSAAKTVEYAKAKTKAQTVTPITVSKGSRRKCWCKPGTGPLVRETAIA